MSRVLRSFLPVRQAPIGWPDCRGTGDRIAMEWVAEMPWNRRPVSRGIGGRIAVEYANGLPNYGKVRLFEVALKCDEF